jgi:TatD DNase family protein
MSAARVYTDSHAHLGDLAPGEGGALLAGLLAAYGEAWAEEGGAERPLLVDVGVEAGDFPPRFARLGRRPFLRYSLGLWPGREALADPEASLAALARDLEAAGEDAAAIGECGLDYHHMEAPKEAQAALFEGQIGLAREWGLPLIVHSREAFEDTRALLKARGEGLTVIIHCFGYGPAEVGPFLDLGCHISFAGNLTYKKAAPLREALALVPADRLLLETDAPYMNPEPGRGRPSSPLDVVRTYALAAELRGVAQHVLAATVAANARLIFG